MGEWLSVAVTIGTVGLLILSGFWASKRFADFDMLPGHYDWAGRASRMTRRKTMVWLLPVIFSAMMIVYGAMALFMHGDQAEAGLPPWLLISAICLLAAQALVLWLTDRWAKQQREQR